MPETPVIRLPRSRDALGTPRAAAILKQEIEALPAACLPLQALLTRTACALDDFGVTVLAIDENTDPMRIRIGVFLQGLDPGCSCADDPTPVEPLPEYGELEVEIDRRTAQARFRLP